MSKSHLVPLSRVAMKTIPRIELNGAKLAVKLCLLLQEELDMTFSSTNFWTDSMTVLRYLRNKTDRFHRFVENRVAFINTTTELAQWKFVPGKENPADLGTRGQRIDEFLASEKWTKGPAFLQQSKDQWPTETIEPMTTSNEDLEIKKEKLTMTTIIQEKTPVQKLLESASDWNKLVKKVAWMLKIKACLKNKVKLTPTLSIDELEEAELEIYRQVQKDKFATEINAMKKGQMFKDRNIKKLQPFIGKEDVIRVGGRLQNSSLDYGAKHQILLPKNHHVVGLLIKKAHQAVGHLGKASTVTHLRQKYWIIHASVVAKKLINECLICRKLQAKPANPLMAELPGDRVLGESPPFQNIGIDCFGPFVVVRGRAKVKRYGLVFTCLASRAIHLEVLHHLTTDSFIQAFIRFQSRRGRAKIIRSDNGLNFVGAEKELKRELEQWNKKHIQSWLQQERIKWIFNPPLASNMGGVWEREIRTIRKVLNGLMKEQQVHLDDEQLNTLMHEVEAILNGRPLLELSEEADSIQPLTPNDLLLLQPNVCFPIGFTSQDDLSVRKRWKQAHYLADLFWKRWKREYLPLLQKRQKWNVDAPPHKKGDLVLLIDHEFVPRNQWKMGKIEETYPDKNGRVRIVKVRVNNFDLKSGKTFLTRPINKLILLRTCWQIEGNP